MPQIEIYGWPSFQAWVESGYKGARSFHADGSLKGVRPAPLRIRPKCGSVDCDRAASCAGLCWLHYERQRVRNRALA